MTVDIERPLPGVPGMSVLLVTGVLAERPSRRRLGEACFGSYW